MGRSLTTPRGLTLAIRRYSTHTSDYCANRESWFADIIAWHNIPPQVDATTPAKDAAKALPIRLLHGGTYAKWGGTPHN